MVFLYFREISVVFEKILIPQANQNASAKFSNERGSQLGGGFGKGPQMLKYGEYLILQL